MAKRMILMLVVVAGLLGAVAWVKYSQIQEAMAQAGSFQPPPEAVTTVVATAEEWPDAFTAVGSLSPVQGVTVSADMPGVIEEIAFESGAQVKAGDVLVRLDARQEEAQLTAALAEAELARVDLDRMRQLVEEKVAAQAELDRLSAGQKQAAARVGEIRATIERKTIRAPFAGVLGIRSVDLGAYVTSGDPIVPLQSLDPIYVDFMVPQQDVSRLEAGRSVTIAIEGQESAVDGLVSAVDSVVDPETRNVHIQATIANPDASLKPGMFVEVSIALGAATKVVALPASAVSYAPYGDSVFIVEDVKGPDGKSYRGVRQQFVKLGGARGDQVGVLSGVEPGQEVVSSGVFKLRNGAAVSVDNSIQPGNEPAPEPQDS